MSDPQPLVLAGIRHAYGDHLVWSDLSLSVDAGEFVALIGESGSGKTTLLRAIAGLICPDSGHISIDGVSVFKDGENVIPCESRGVGLVFQEYALFPHMTVRENVTYGLQQPSPGRVDGLLTLVGIGPELADRRPAQLSGGQQQRVALARALAPRPALLLLDEPFSNVDAGRRHALGRLLRRITTEEGASVLMVTHDHEAAMALSDRMVVLGPQGHGVVQDAPPVEVYRRPVNASAAEMTGRCSLIPGEVASGSADTVVGPIPVCADFEGTATLVLRPEGLAFVCSADGPVSVTGVQFAGAHHVLSCDTAAGPIEAIWSSQDPPPKIGTRGQLQATSAAWPIPRG